MNRIPPRKHFFIHPEQTNKKLNDKEIVVQKKNLLQKSYTTTTTFLVKFNFFRKF